MKINYKNIILATAFFALGFISHYFFLTPQHVEQGKDFTLFWDVWKKMEKKYPFTEPSSKEKEYSAIEGLVKSYGDDHSIFFPPKPSKQFLEDVSGHFGGAGMEVAMNHGFLQVIAPLKNSPAEKAGFLPGDIVTHIAGVKTYGKNLNDLISEIRGKIGTSVEITVVRLENEKPILLKLIRGEVIVPVLDNRIIDDNFIISLYNFNQYSKDDFKKAIEKFKKSKKKHLILDLRNNPGGYLNSAIDILSYFFDQGIILVKEDFGDSGKKQSIHRSKGFDILKDYDYDIKVLVNQGSASASEIVAGALKDYKKAIIIGEQTYGKGSVQELINLNENTSLKVTVAKWLTPLNHQISKIGIKPDVFIENINSLKENDLFDRVINDKK